MSEYRGEQVPQEEEAESLEVSTFRSIEGQFFSRQPSWWLVRILAVLAIALIFNAGLLAATVGKPNRATYNTEVEPKFSAKLNNAPIPRWKPLPDSTQTLTKIAFGSCASQEMPQPHWDTISFQQPDLFLLTGDNVYGDCLNASCTTLREAYRKMALHPSVQGGAAALSVFATLDDHDYGQDNCDASNPYKDLAKELFQEFFDIPSDTLPWHDGVYRSRMWGAVEGERLQVILLDTRYGRGPFYETGNRSAPYRPAPEDDMEQHMLSLTQWLWLERQLEHPADLRVIVSSVQVLNEGTAFEAWRHFPMEQDRLYKLLQDKRVIFLSGDRHFGGFYESASLLKSQHLPLHIRSRWELLTTVQQLQNATKRTPLGSGMLSE